MSTQSVMLKSIGLQTFPNQLSYSSGYVSESSAPQGSLAQADDVVINRDNVIEPRRGFAVYGNAMGSSPTVDMALQLMTYKDRLFRHFANVLQFDDGTGTFTSFTAGILPVVSGLRIKYAESNGNLYFTTSTGINKISAKTAADLSASSVVPAGMQEALDITLSLNSAQGFFNQESTVGYRALWGIKDANQNLVLGSPSNRQIISNALTPLLVNDFNTLLTTLDTLSVSTGIHFGNYHSSFNVPVVTNSSALRNNIIALTNELDADIATNSHWSVALSVLDFTGATSGNTITVSSTTGILVGQLVTVDPTKITAGAYGGTTTTTNNQITGLSSSTGIVVGQLVTCTAAGILPAGTTVTSAPSGGAIGISSLPLIAGTFTTEFNFTNPNPFPVNTVVTGLTSTVVTLNNSTTFTGTYPSAINYQSLYSVLAPSTIIPANTPTASTPTTSSSTNGLTYNVTAVLFGNPVGTLQIGDPIQLSNVVPGTFNTSTGIVQSLGTTFVTFNMQTNPGTYVSGVGVVSRSKYEYLVQPLALSPDPLSNQLTSIQTYYQSILTILQTEPTTIVGSSNPFLVLGTTQTATVNLTFPIPQGITTANFFQIYRTEQLSTSAGPISLDSLDPGDEEFLAFEANPTSTDLSNGFITVQDIEPDAYLGASLYTNANSGQGITSANVPPPLAQDVTLYYSYMFYANTISYHTLNTTLLGVSNMVSGTSTLTITNGTTTNTYTFSTAAENPATKHIHISTLSTPAQQIDETARSIVNVINRNASEIVYAFYESGPTDVPGKILLQSRTLGTPAFVITVDNAATTGSEFNPAIPASGSSTFNTSDNETRPNRLFYSAQFQPDAVPIVNTIDIGPQDKKILRVIGLRQSLFVFKEEGIYRITGTTAQSFIVSLFDSSSLITAPDSACVLNNTIYCLTNQGVVNVSDSGVSILSRPIEGSLVKLNSTAYPNFTSSTFGVGYEADRTYNLWTVTNKTDTKATQAFRYNTVTQAWTRCTKTATCGVINFLDGKMYLGATDINFIEQERKNFDRTDYADREHALAISGVNGTVLNMGTVNNVTVGDVVLQTQYLTIAQYNRLIGKLERDLGLHSSYVALIVTAGANLRTQLTTLAAELVADTGTHTKTYSSAIAGFTDSFADTQAAFNTIIALLNNDTGLAQKNYTVSTGTVSFEIDIVGVTTKTITTSSSYPFIVGPVTTFEHIDSVMQWLPSSMGDPSMSKQVSEATVIFEQMSFTEMMLSFSTDLNPGFVGQEFPEVGNGSFGSGVYGNSSYGNGGNSIPLRTYVPQQLQRCRFMNVKLEHSVARESFAVFGASLTYNQTSQKAWR